MTLVLGRWIRFLAGWITLLAALVCIGLCINARATFWDGEGAQTIGVPVERPVMPVGMLTFGALLLALALVSTAGFLAVRANWKPWLDR